MTISEPQEKIRVEYIDDRPVVSARELHEALGIHTIFRQWFPRMCEYGFMEGLDYTKIYQKKEGSRTGQIEVDYEISMDMAKHICMMQRTREGMECRQYFIDLERAWNSPENILQRALQIAGRKIEELQSQNRLLVAANHRKEQTIQGTDHSGIETKDRISGYDTSCNKPGTHNSDREGLRDEYSEV